MNTVVGVADAKTRLPELLRRVKAGERFTIANRGKAIADLVPSEASRGASAKSAIERFLAFLSTNPIRGGRRQRVTKLIDEGRA
jgi:prevent-host-death family protein